MRPRGRTPRILALLAVVAFTASACDQFFKPDGFDGTSENLPGTERVLFIGNSHSYVNSLPAMVEQLARLGGDTALRTAYIAFANWSLENHYNSGPSRGVLSSTEWEYVVLQQGTSAAPASQLHLQTWASAFEPLIREAGAEPVLYQIWPLETERNLADDALMSYHNAAVAVEGIFAPAGDAFTAALGSNPEIVVYSADGLHASVFGTYLAALVILERVAGIHPESLPLQIPYSSGIDTAVIAELQAAAAVAVARNPARPTVPLP